MRVLCAALACLAAFPATARSEQATIVARDLPTGLARTAAGMAAPIRFDLVGLHWQGSGTVVFRTRSLSGRWSAWRPAAPEAEDEPDPSSPESLARRGWRLGSPYWTGPSDRVAYRLEGDVRRLRAWYVWSPIGTAAPARTLSAAGSPRIVPRRGWGAIAGILRAPPRYAPQVRLAIVHHTAGSNDYTRAESPAIVRAIELYHVRGNGWNDIGYNVLVDKYGQVFEGRAGGIDRNVIGAHAEGFNAGSVGVAVIGSYSATSVAPAAEHALAALLAWRLDVAHVDPLGFVTWISGGNAKFPKGSPVLLRDVSGHRDTGYTDCPGGRLSSKLPALAHEAAAIGLPKLYAPSAQGAAGGPVRFTARLSSARPWMVTVQDARGALVSRGTGVGANVDWTWSSAGAPPGRYAWTIAAGPSTRPAQGSIVRRPSSPPPPTPPPATPFLVGLTLDPPVLSPDGDGIADVATVSYSLGERAAVTATVADAGGRVVATLFADQLQGARRQSFPYAAEGLADGAYELTISAAGADGRTARATASFALDRTLSGLTLTTTTLSPNGDGSGDTLGIDFTLASAAAATVQIEQAGVVVATVFAGPLPAGASRVFWDGTTPTGPAPAGEYTAAVVVDGPFGVTRHEAPFSLVR